METVCSQMLLWQRNNYERVLMFVYIPSAPSSLGTMKPSTSDVNAATIKINNVKS